MAKCRLVIGGCLIWLSMLSFADNEARPVLRVVSDVWAPMTGPSLTRNGMSIHFAQQLFDELGYDIKVSFLPWKRIEKMMGTDQFDVIAALWKTSDREKKMAFTKAYEHNRLVFISREVDQFAYTNANSFNGLSVGLVSGYAYPDAVFQLENVEFQYVAESRQNILKLARGRVHLIIGDYFVMKYEASRHLSPYQKLHFDLENALSDVPLFMAVSRSHPEHEALVEKLDILIDQHIQSGRYEQLKQFHGL